MDWRNDVLSLLSIGGALLAGGWGAFKLFGGKWLDNALAERLASFKHQQSIEIESIRFRIDVLKDRTAILHQQEFTVLPEIWDRLTIAVSEGTRISARNLLYPSIARMGDGELNDYFESTELRDWQKQLIREVGGEERDSRLRDMIFWHRMHHANHLHSEFQNYLIAKGIFIQPELRERIRTLSNWNWDALSERRIFQEVGGGGDDSFSRAAWLAGEGATLMGQIGEAIRLRLWEEDRRPDEANVRTL